MVAIFVGQTVQLPGTERVGEVIDICTNPACLMRVLIVRWRDGEVEELNEIEFGPLSD